MFELPITAVTIFVVTNMDDFVTLNFLFTSNYRASNIVFGQFVGIISLTVFSILIALLSIKVGDSFHFANEWTGLFGLMPIGIGLWTIFKESEDEMSIEQTSGWRQIIVAAGLTIGGGGDNISIYTPFFLPLSWWQIVEVMIIFIVMTGIWCFLVHNLSKYFRFDRFAEQISGVLPYFFICFGVYILLNNGTIAWLYTFLG